ncbi:MAG: GatB/YqeY domain-containing protein [Acidobacteria bacterium]|nr:MAG: GatB/YqeY domain-containing protein [Acidobacteriota bacterium]REK02579.1 MAG: GatB/YqeY domain-containing protein [Acidobacteriota bacterium]REK13618.1 MAG: GatB/YqeY domain-containing protein [Acidobacteriota bacterium]REK41612.1 MAG: GatB/YqeY domain-containing protein [Acidobacteriota bacterium]
MSLQEKIVEDMKSAMKAKDANRLSTLRMVKATLMNKQIETGKELSDEDTIRVLNTLLKQRRDSAEQYANAGRDELAEKENAEISVIEEYLPAAASDEEIDRAVSKAVEKTGASSMRDMGAVMKAALAELSGKTVDGKAVSEAVKNKLS